MTTIESVPTHGTLHDQLRRRVGLPEHEVELDDEPRQDGTDRYAIYSVDPQRGNPVPRHELATTSRFGIGGTLVTLREEGQITNDSRIGILDRETRTWVINPWGKGGAA